MTRDEGVGHSDEGLVLERVAKSFGRRGRARQAVADLDLRVDHGRFVCLIGPSGCGKSTVLRLAAGLVSADSGSVRLFGEDVALARREKRIGYVPQSPALLEWRNVLDNVRFPLEVNRGAAVSPSRTPEELLLALGLGDVLQRHPAELSGGMQQRVAIARAFAFGPSVLLMDEPFSAVDEMTRESLRHELLSVWQADQRLVLFVTHSVAEAVVLADEVVVLSPRPGRVAARIPVELARPRTAELEDSSEVHAVAREVRSALRAVTEGSQ
ncbi:MAG: ATP-binding cassette domain-containing protein [Actinomycetota bacterium]|nr:ATP-binding cassette domain-containing protein [Actinomycetota bacterium]